MSVYVKSVEIKNDEYNGVDVLKKGFKFDCSDVNLFVGDQGTGKSTLMKLLQSDDKGLEIVVDGEVKSYYFDTEKDNPRLKNPELYTTPSGRDVGIGYIGAFLTRIRSHGEVLRDMVLEPLFEAKDCVILIDEPESGMSLKSQYRLLDGIEEAVKNGCQIFLATHCYPIIERYNVISLDNWKPMSGKDYIKKQIKNGRK